MLFKYFLKTICVVVVLIIIGVFCVEKDDYQSSSHFNNNRGQTILDKQSDYVGGIRSSITIEDLLHNTYSTKISNDLDVDICKAGGFQGDIALPNINYEREYLQLKKEVSEGLQVEEEGLTDYLRIKLKQAAHPEDYLATTKKPKSHYNDPESDLLQHQNYFEQKQQNGGIKNNIDLKKNHHLQNGDLQQNGGLKKYNKLHNHVTTAVPNHINVMPTKINESDLQDEVNRTFEEGSDVEKLKNDSMHGKSSEEIGLEVTSAQSMSTIPTFSSSSSSVENTSNAGGKREKKRHKRRRRRFRKRKLTSNTYNEMKSEGGDDTSSQTNITVQLSTSSSTLAVASPPSSVNSTNNSNSHSNKTHDHINSLANSQSTSSSSSSLQQTNSSHRITRSLLTKYLYSTTNINNNKESYDDDINDVQRRRRRRRSKSSHGRRIVHRHEITNSEIPVHEFEERFEGPPKPPHKVLPTSSSSKHDNNLNFIKGLFPIVDNTNILGDDIAEQRHVRVTRAATARKERIWDYGVIPYEIDTNFSGAHKALFKQAMRHWENSTCVKFVERVPDEHPNYIIFTERPCGCCSFVGKRGNGAQAISIGKNCDKFGIVVHELGHVVGFWHEHTRPDRDNHVQIFREHIMNGQDYNFNKLTEEEVNSLGLPYDYDSIMHYAKNTFSRGSYLDTIAPQENKIRGKPVPEIGQRLRLSQGDIAQTNLLYKCAKCGRTFQENSGTFSSPNYPNLSRGESEKCEWRITATHGERIVLNITELDIFKSNDCGSDYIEIKDGYWHKSPNLGRFCGSGRLVDPIISTGSRMLVTYITSAKSIEHRGFSASYEAVCGGELEVTTGGHLESPNYPEDYLKNKECVWKLIVPPTFTVALRFQSFEIENHDNCVYDYVEVIDGFEPDSPQIGKFCGYKVPPDIKSTSNHLLVKFFSDGSVQKAGFSASFMKEYNECNQTNHGCEHDCINTLGSYECACRIGYELHSDGKHCEAACGGIYDSPNGTITSPSFPALYPENKNCIWEIIAPPQFRITLNFTHFDLEGNNLYQQECDYDSVIVQSKLADDVIKKHGTYCGTVLPDMITSEGNSLRIIFSSDLTVQKSGFAAIFFTDMDECAIDNGGCQHECSNTIGSYKCSCHNGFTLHENGHDCKEGGCKFEVTSPHGEITSPNYPDHYPSRKDCVWHFVTTPGHRIKLNFEKFEMEPHPDCAYDHIVLYDGDSPESRTLGRYCGSKLPHPIIASSNQMFMVFKSDASVQRKGFRAIHSTACGGLLQATGTVKHFYSHSKYGDHNYANRMDCEWTIQPLARRSVILTFLTFELEDEITNCSYDYVSIVAGLDASGYKYGRYCGSKMPSTIISNGEALVVRFRSDDSIVSKGFSASYVAGDQFDITDESEMGLEAADDDDLDSDDEDTIINNNNDNSSLENY